MKLQVTAPSNENYYLGNNHDESESILISQFDDSQMDQITAAAYQSYNDTTMSSSSKQPFMTEIQQGVEYSNHQSQKQILSERKLLGFLKDEKKYSLNTKKLPSINATDDFYSPNSPPPTNLLSNNEQQISLMPNIQKEWYLPKIDEEKKGVEKSEKDVFYSQYKNLNKITQYDKKYKLNKFQYKSMCQKAEDCNLLPKTFKIFNFYSDINKELNLNNYGIGDKYCQVFSEALQVEDLQHLQKLKISQNNLRGGSLNRIFKSCTSKVKVLDVSGNSVRQEALATFKPLFARTTLAVLNISHCKIGDVGFNELYQNMKENKHLKVLNMSMNNLTEISSQKLKKILMYNTSLIELYLHWNNFKNEGGVEILKGVYENNYLKVLDISYNSLKYQGEVTESNYQKTSAYQIQQILLKDTCELIHLDLSYNNFSPAECWLYGIHFEGNSNYAVDSNGFLVELKKGFRPRMQHKREIKSIKQIPFFSEDELWDGDGQQLQDICWICQGWQEVLIEARDIVEEPLFIHLSFQDFKPELLKKNEDGQYLKLIMIPKNKKVDFFFSNPLSSSKGLVTIYHESYRRIMQNQFLYKFDTGEKEIALFVYHMNSILAGNNIQFEVGNHYKIKTRCCPREQILAYHLPKSDWDISKSIWKDYKGDSNDTLKKCLDFDLLYSRMTKFVKDQDDFNLLKDLVLEKYQSCKDVYRALAAQQPQGDIFCIGSGTFQRMISKTKTLEGGKIKLSDIDRLFIATNFNQETNDIVLENNPTKALVRFEFIEILVRIAHEKYPQMKYSDAFSYYYENDLKEHFNTYPISHDWRVNKYWTKDIEHELKNEISMIKPIYESLVAKNPACYQSSIKYVDLVTFSDFMISKITHLHPLTTTLEISIRTAFIMSLQCSADELTTTLHKQMGLIEFIEAIVRTSEFIFPDEDLPLNVKIQKILFEIYDEDEKQEVLRRIEYENIKRVEDEKKEIKRILLKTRKDYEFKSSVSQVALQKFSKVKLLSHQSRFLPTLFNNHQTDLDIHSVQHIRYLHQ